MSKITESLKNVHLILRCRVYEGLGWILGIVVSLQVSLVPRQHSLMWEGHLAHLEHFLGFTEVQKWMLINSLAS